MSEFTQLKYPEARREEHNDILHGIPVPDPYRWMEDIDAPETIRWIKAQNQLSQEYFSRIPARETICRRITELWDYEKYGVPFEKGGRIFFTLNDGLRNQSVLYWIASPGAEPKELLDPNQLSEDGTVALTGFAVSEDGTILAYGLSTSGSDWQEWRFRKVEDGLDLEDRLNWVKFTGASWTHDGSGFFYSRYDEPEQGDAYKGANYYHKLYFHRLGTAQADDLLVYERPDQKEWGFSGEVSEDGRYLLIFVWKGTHRENGLFYKDLRSEQDEVVELLKEFDAAYEYVGNDGPHFYILTDLDAPKARLIAIDIVNPARSNWLEIVAESKDALQTASLIQDKFIGVYLHDAYNLVRVFDKLGHFLYEVALPGMGTTMGFEGSQKDKHTYYYYTGFTSPGLIYRYDVEQNTNTLFRQPHLNFNPDDYVTEQVFYPSKDGTRVPLFITHKKGLKPDGKTPTYLYGYGGFNIPQTPGFSVSNLVWMEMGGIYAQANLRGGGEYGKAWHEAGTKLLKQNVFDDFIAAAEYLIDKGYTNRSRLAIAGRSNGGLLTGACLTQRPDLYGAVLVIVGVLDMLRFHTFTIGWGWVSDYGSPDDEMEFKALLAYSPYHNVKPGTTYPPTLITTGDHDDRVFPAHSFKFGAALQAAQGGNAPILVRIETKAGHGLGKPTSKLIEESADMWAFLVHNLNIVW